MPSNQAEAAICRPARGLRRSTHWPCGWVIRNARDPLPSRILCQHDIECRATGSIARESAPHQHGRTLRPNPASENIFPLTTTDVLMRRLTARPPIPCTSNLSRSRRLH